MRTLEGTGALFCVLQLELYYNLYICHFRLSIIPFNATQSLPILSKFTQTST